MSGVEDMGVDEGGDAMLAAEYVLGVLPASEREEAARRIEREPAFARLVETWEEQLSPLNAEYEPVEPPAGLKAALDSRLFPAQQRAPRQNLLESLMLWRGLAAAAVAALVVFIGISFFQPAPTVPVERLVASLASEETDVRYLALYDAHEGAVSLSHVTGAREAGRDFELWIIEGEAAPASLGVIPVGASVRMAVAPERAGMIGSGALFAISLEPEGGSPTGQPTGPVVAAGDLSAI